MERSYLKERTNVLELGLAGPQVGEIWLGTSCLQRFLGQEKTEEESRKTWESGIALDTLTSRIFLHW